ncbi:putative kinesin-like protein KIN-12C [Cocos nucifera]|uniref:Putative kinesin-like protein KIN-12C n=1 Tax=Cocos nucifera TaxID=13894 RepID=A0A8K0N0L9_COCNU|nr:putative kinesin-like protein KIN-12C [Cocos nucifera]
MSFSSRRSSSRTRPAEGNENEHGNPADPVHLPPPRSPLISIQDQSQNPREGPSSELRLADFPIKGSGATPRSAPSTPARGLSRVCSGIGSSGANNAGHQLAGRERGFSSRVSTGIPEVKHLVPVDVPHFELNEDPSFWKDHNVQEKLFKVVGLPMVENCMSGYNSCMFAYGQGAANRKMAATHMNLESSRSHSILTCVIESRWEKDSMTHLRFGRLNLVDLAGSESLVIMTLVDIANGKSRHVPYRDSRLTFLLQAKVNEDASGDVMALQRQIQTLKDQLNFLIKHQSVPRSLYYPSLGLDLGNSGGLCDDFDSLGGGNPNAFSDLVHLNQKIKHLETALTGALRREKIVEAEVRRLEAEIKHMNRLVHQREDDAQRNKVMLRLREDKLRRLEMLADDVVTSDGYLMGENAALSKEIQLLQERMESNPDLTQFALENMRLVEQLRMFQNFYHQGERELLLADVSHLRNQGDDSSKELDTCKRQLDACQEDNARLTWEIDNLRCQLKQYLDFEQTAIVTVGDASTVNDRNNELHKQTATLAKWESEGWTASYSHADKFPHISPAEGMMDVPSQFGDVEKELKDARVLIRVMESQQIQLIAQLDKLEQENDRFLELLQSQVHDETCLKKHHNYGMQFSEKLRIVFKASHADEVQIPEFVDTQKLALGATLDNVVKDVEEAKIMDKQHKDEHISTWQQEIERVQEQVEVETAKTILSLQEEIAALQQEVLSRNTDELSSAANYELLRTRNEELNNQVHILMQENVKLSNLVAAGDAETSALSDEWEKAIIDLTEFLLDGWKSLEDASQYTKSIVNSFPQGNAWINEHVERAIKVFVGKEKLIADLQKRVNDAQQIELEMKLKLDSLRGATLAITEVQQIEHDENAKELIHLRKLLDEQEANAEESSYALEELRDQVEMAIQSTYSAIKMLFHDSINDVHEINDRIRELKAQRMTLPSTMIEYPKFGGHADIKSTAIQIIMDGLAKIKKSLSGIKSGFHLLFNASKTSSIHKHGNKLIPNLMEDVEIAMNALVEIRFQLGMLFHVKDAASGLAQGIRSNEPPHAGADNMVLDVIPKYPSDQIATSQLSHMLQNLEERIEEVDVDHCRNKEKLRLKMSHAWRDAEEKTKQTTGFLQKFEKAQETMEEAEVVLQALLKANEDAKCERDRWKQASQELLADRTTLVEELHRLEALNFSVDNQNQNLEKQVHSSIAEILGIAISLSESFVEMQRITLEEVNVICSDMFSFGHELLQWIGTSRSWLEETISEIMEKGFALLVLHQCHIGAFSEQNKHLSVASLEYSQLGSYSVLGNVDNNRMNVPIDTLITEGLADVVAQNDCKLNFFGETGKTDKLISSGASFFDIHKDLELKSNIFQDDEVGILKCEKDIHDDRISGAQTDIKVLLVDIGHLKHQCAQLIASHLDLEDDGELSLCQCNNVQESSVNKHNVKLMLIISCQGKLEAQLAESEAALSSSKSELEQAQKICVMLTNENTELKLLLEDEHIRNTQTEELLEEKRTVIDGLERQILSNNSSIEGILDNLTRVSNERNNLQAEIANLNDKLDMAMTLVDEKEAIGVEARQVAESSKIFAEEKEEEVKILEHCIQELEGTINVLERKVDDMKEEVESHQLIRKHLEQEIQVLTDRMHMVQNAAQCLIVEDSSLGEGSSEIPRQLDDRIIELCEARKHIKDLEMEILYKEKEFKALEGVFSEVNAGASTSNPSESHAANKLEKNSVRTRGSGSPFRCISSLVQQMNLEKDQELSVAGHQIEELEALAANRQKEVCILTARLAAVDSMTHDVIRDLLGVKLDLTNFAEELQKLLMTAQQQIEETKAKDMEILNMKMQINYLLEERDSLVEEVNQRKSDILANQVLIEQLQQRDQLLTAQNEMLKVDKANLHQKIAKMDETVKSLVGSPSIQDHLRHPLKTKESSQNAGSEDLVHRLAESDKLLSHARKELARYHKSSSRMPFDQYQ